MATIIIKNVPAKIGIAPKEPCDPDCPSRIGMYGYHFVPNKNSKTDTSEKNRKLSNNNEKTIPTVVNTATDEQKIKYLT